VNVPASFPAPTSLGELPIMIERCRSIPCSRLHRTASPPRLAAGARVVRSVRAVVGGIQCYAGLRENGNDTTMNRVRLLRSDQPAPDPRLVAHKDEQVSALCKRCQGGGGAREQLHLHRIPQIAGSEIKVPSRSRKTACRPSVVMAKNVRQARGRPVRHAGDELNPPTVPRDGRGLRHRLAVGGR